jgi:hypothetical protein
MLSYSSLVNKGKLTLPSVDTWGTNNNIRKDPPKSIMTRRRDKVSDTNQIVKMVDNSDRSNEAILRFSRGINPSVGVMYSNNGGSLQNYGNKQAFLPYRINKDGDFHPPVQAPLDLLPLSRLKYNNVEVITTPSLPHYTKELPNSRNQTAEKNVKKDIISNAVKTPQTYMLQKPFQEPFEVKYNINENNIKVNAESGKIAYSDRTIQNNVTPSNVIVMDNLNVNVETNKQDRKMVDLNIDLSKIKTQDSVLIEFEGNKKGNEKYEMIHENFELLRNVPEYDMYSNVVGGNKFNVNIHNDMELSRKMPEYNVFSNKNDAKKNYVIEADNEIVLNRNLPEYEMSSVKNGGHSKISFIHDDVVLSRNVPEHSGYSNTSGTEKIEYIHSDIELERVLPEYEATTNISQNMRKTLLHNKMKEYERKAILSQMTTNDSKKGEMNMNNATERKLPERVQPGEFVNSGFVPKVERFQGMENIRMINNNRKLKV